MRVDWIERLLASTRGDVIRLLRRSDLTVNELAEGLRLTDNAVRSHLAALERDGLVKQKQGAPQGVGKPAFVYSLTPQADALLPKAYAPVLGLLLTTLAEKMKPDELSELLFEVGRRAAADRNEPGADLRMRIDAAYGVLGEMGGVAEIVETAESVTIRGYSCPFAGLVPEHPELCQVAEAMLSELVGVAVRQTCEGGARPRCCFEISLNG